MAYKLINGFAILLIVAGITCYIFWEWPAWPIFLVILAYILLMLALSTNIRLNFFVDAYNNNPQYPGKVVALSFDDGPVENTLKILDVLDKYQAKAAFFCIGKNIERKPEVFKEIIDRGHMVGNHTYSHTRKMGFINHEQFYSEIQKCNAIAEEVSGLKMNIFRPPFGIINPKTKSALKRTGHTVMGWSIRPYDAILNSPEYILKRITRKVQSGDLILLHDNKPQSVEILEQLLLFLRSNNFSTVRPDKLFNLDAYS